MESEFVDRITHSFMRSTFYIWQWPSKTRRKKNVVFRHLLMRHARILTMFFKTVYVLLRKLIQNQLWSIFFILQLFGHLCNKIVQVVTKRAFFQRPPVDHLIVFSTKVDTLHRNRNVHVFVFFYHMHDSRNQRNNGKCHRMRRCHKLGY